MRDQFGRWISLLVIVSFCCATQLSASPGSGKGEDKKATSETIEKTAESPQIGVEKEASSSTTKKKHSALPWVLGGLGIAGIAFLLLSKKSNTLDKQTFFWDITFHPRSSYGAIQDISLILKFSGSDTSGSVAIYNSSNIFINGSGSYSFNDNVISIRWKSFSGGNTLDNLVLSGLVANDNTYNGDILEGVYFSGTMIFNITGTWNAIKRSN